MKREMTNSIIQRERNETLRLLDIKRKKHISPEVQLNAGNSWTHELRKVQHVFLHMKEGHSIVTEAYFENGSRCDVLCLDCRQIIEIVVSESEESLLRKKLKYPKELDFKIARV